MTQFANIQWRESDNATLTPYSLDFNDVYFNTENGLAETDYVFITQNQLQARFSTLKNECFTVIETGFGTGLNFLAIASLWLALAPPSATLRYISIEKLPLTLDDLRRAQATWPQFAAISHEFLQHYAHLKLGNNQFSMAAGRIDIGLQANDVLNALPQIEYKADAWLLDGFAPAKNAAMWTSAVFTHMARLSKKGTTFATFTSAGAVRRGLEAAGFAVEKPAGFGKKREMLRGEFLGNSNNQA